MPQGSGRARGVPRYTKYPRQPARAAGGGVTGWNENEEQRGAPACERGKRASRAAGNKTGREARLGRPAKTLGSAGHASKECKDGNTGSRETPTAWLEAPSSAWSVWPANARRQTQARAGARGRQKTTKPKRGRGRGRREERRRQRETGPTKGRRADRARPSEPGKQGGATPGKNRCDSVPAMPAKQPEAPRVRGQRTAK